MRTLNNHEIDKVSGAISGRELGSIIANRSIEIFSTVGDFLGRLAGQTVVLIRDGRLPAGIDPISPVNRGRPSGGGGSEPLDDDS